MCVDCVEQRFETEVLVVDLEFVELKEYHGVHTICPLCPDKVTESDC